MGVEILPESLLKGKFLHCQPSEGIIVTALIAPYDGALTDRFKVGIVCPVRRPGSMCEMTANYCLYWKGDSCGVYQIIGPNMDEKLIDLTG